MTQRKNNKLKFSWEDLNFPVYENPLLDPPALSMDEYHRFVLRNLKLFPSQTKPDQQPVNVRFKLE